MTRFEEQFASTPLKIERMLPGIGANLAPRRLHRLTHRRIERSRCLMLRHCAAIVLRARGSGDGRRPTINVRPFAGHIASMGFAGTYTDEGAEFEATALVGKRSIRLKTVFRLLIPD